MVINSRSKLISMSRDTTKLKSFLICIMFGKNDFFLLSRCPISIYAKLEKLILLFSNPLGHTFALNVFQSHSVMKVFLKQ